MAEGGNVPELGGYEYEFTSKVPEDWECRLCHLTVKDPVQIVGCGHRLCNICMESLFRHPSPTCPADRQPLLRDKIFPDTACRHKILDLTVKCSHSGCSWTGELHVVEKHQSECPFKVVKCPNSGCTEKLIMRNLRGHVEFECSWRKVNCEYCQESFIMNQKQEHFDVCPNFPVECSNKCGLRDMPRDKLEIHIRDACPATEVLCKYKNLGCEGKFPRSNAKLHLQTQVESHLNLALGGLEATQLQVNELIGLVKEQSQQIEQLMSQNKEQSVQIEQLMSQNKEQSVQIERHEQIINIVSPFFEWKIPKFKDICSSFLLPDPRRAFKNEEKVILSEPFHLCGYRYSLQIIVRPVQYLGYSMELCIRVIPGEFDSLLSWPCMEKLRVTLIDQDPCQDNRVNISYVIDFDNKEKPCSRPSTEDTHKYRCIFHLYRKKLENRSYIQNDTIFIMVNKE